MVKNLPANAGVIRDVGSVPGLGRSPGGGHGNALQPGGEQSTGLQSRTPLKKLSMHTSLQPSQLMKLALFVHHGSNDSFSQPGTEV